MNVFASRSLCVIDDFSINERRYFFKKVYELKKAILDGDEKTKRTRRIWTLQTQKAGEEDRAGAGSGAWPSSSDRRSFVFRADHGDRGKRKPTLYQGTDHRFDL